MISYYGLTRAAPPTVIKPPTPRASGEIEGCIVWFEASDSIDCGTMLLNVDLNIAVFYEMNPSVGSDCTRLSLGTNYCLSTKDIGIYDPYQDGGSIYPSPTLSKPPVGSGTPMPIQVNEMLLIWKLKLTCI